jgi:hypothetical protein
LRAHDRGRAAGTRDKNVAALQARALALSGLAAATGDPARATEAVEAFARGPSRYLIAAGLLLDLKTSAKLTLGMQDVFQIIGYAPLDFDDEYNLAEVGIFSARYAYLASWSLPALPGELAGYQISLQATRQEFCQLLLTHQGLAR